MDMFGAKCDCLHNHQEDSNFAGHGRYGHIRNHHGTSFGKFLLAGSIALYKAGSILVCDPDGYNEPNCVAIIEWDLNNAWPCGSCPRA